MNANPIVWDDKYRIGHEDIDTQHKYFVQLINRLSDNLREANDAESLSPLIAELNAYARFHFISEENMMRRAGYPGLEQHKIHHLELIDSLSSKEALLSMEGHDDAADRIIDFLSEWFIHHTNEEDRLFTDFLKEQASQRAPN